MAKWINRKSAGCLIPGDIIEVSSKIPGTNITVPMITHYGVITFVCKVPYITHCPWNHTPVFESLEDFERRRTLIRVLRNEDTKKMTDEQIVNNYYKFKDKVYDFFSYNCEDYTKSIVNTDIGFDQRKGYIIGLLIVLFLIYIGYTILKKR